MNDKKSLSQLTRSLMVGASVGTVALTQVGCTPEQLAALGVENAATSSGQQARTTVSSVGERNACNRAIQSRSAADMNALMSRYPGSNCIVPLLNALPGSTLGALSPTALQGLRPPVRNAIPGRVARQLPSARQTASNNGFFDDDDSNGDDRGGY